MKLAEYQHSIQNKKPQGVIYIYYISDGNHHIMRRIAVSGTVGYSFNYKAYTSEQRINAALNRDKHYVLNRLGKKVYKYQDKPQVMNIYVRSQLVPQVKPKADQKSKIIHQPVAKQSKIILDYVCDHQKLVKQLVLKGRPESRFILAPYISNQMIKKLSHAKHTNYMYDYTSGYIKRYPLVSHIIHIFISTVQDVTPKKVKNGMLQQNGKVLIKYVSKSGHVVPKKVVARGIIGTPFDVRPYTLDREINHNVKIGGVSGLLTCDYVINNIKFYEPQLQTVYISVKEKSIEISMTMPLMLLDSLDRYIHMGRAPFFAGSGPVDTSRSTLVRYLISSSGDYSTKESYQISNEVWANSKQNGYMSLETSVPNVIKNSSTRVYRLICAMVNERIPIVEYAHDKKGHPTKVIHVLYPRQYSLNE